MMSFLCKCNVSVLVQFRVLYLRLHFHFARKKGEERGPGHHLQSQRLRNCPAPGPSAPFDACPSGGKDRRTQKLASTRTDFRRGSAKTKREKREPDKWRSQILPRPCAVYLLRGSQSACKSLDDGKVDARPSSAFFRVHGRVGYSSLRLPRPSRLPREDKL